MSDPITPGEVEVYSQFSKHLGSRFMAAGLRIRFYYNQTAGVHFKANVNEEFREAIVKGIKDGLSARFPDFPTTGSVWITEVNEHPVDSSARAFYLAARAVIEQAYALTQLHNTDLKIG